MLTHDSAHCDRFVRMEGLLAIVLIFLCWFVGIFLYEEDMSLTRYAIIAVLIMLALCFLVRLTHWAWPDTAYSVAERAKIFRSTMVRETP
jgi:hypothetical protein